MQTTDTILMVRPAAFRSNPGTLASNPFQAPSELGEEPLEELNARARAEFDALASALRAAQVRVLCLQDDTDPATPDSIFPNNWFSTHTGGRLILYPMQEASRRRERRLDLLEPALLQAGFASPTVQRGLVQRYEGEGLYLEGTGSMVLDRVQRVAYACRSVRTDEVVLQAFCEANGFRAHLFDAKDANGLPYYHTNVIMALGLDFAVICLEALPAHQHADLVQELEAGRRRLIFITREQALRFAGNLLELRTLAGERLVVLSASAHGALGELQRAQLSHGKTRLLVLPITHIERYGGGSVRCMLAEIFLPRRDAAAATGALPQGS